MKDPQLDKREAENFAKYIMENYVYDHEKDEWLLIVRKNSQTT